MSSPDELYGAADALGIEHTKIATAIGFLLSCKAAGELKFDGPVLTMETKDKR